MAVLLAGAADHDNAAAGAQMLLEFRPGAVAGVGGGSFHNMPPNFDFTTIISVYMWFVNRILRKRAIKEHKMRSENCFMIVL